MHADPVTDNLYLVLDENDEPSTPYLPGTSTAPIPDATYDKLTRLTELGEETAVFEVPPGTLPAP